MNRIILFIAAMIPFDMVAATPPIEVYGQLPALDQAVISPSGERIALSANMDGTRRVIILDGQGELVSANRVGDAKVRELDWAGDRYLVVWTSSTEELDYRFSTQKAELSNAHILDLQAGTSDVVFGADDNMIGGVNGFYGLNSRDGKWFGYFSGNTMSRSREQGGGYRLEDLAPDLYEIDMSDGGASRLDINKESGIFHDWLIGEDGKIAADLEVHAGPGSWTLRSGNRKLADGSSPYAEITILGFGTNGDSVIYSESDPETAINRWFEIPLSGGAATEVLPDLSARRAFFSEDRRLVGVQTGGPGANYKFFDPLHQQIMGAAQRAFPGKRVELVDASADFMKLIVKTQGSGDPGTWWLVDISSGSAVDLGVSYTLRAADVGAVERFAYTAADGLDMEGILTLPPGQESATNLPAIILPHGGPAAHDEQMFDWWAQAFASRGYAVFQPNFRGSTGYGAAFRLAGHGEWGRKMQTDLSDGLHELVRKGIVDPERVCIMGASYGGYAALAGVTMQSGIYRCAVAVNAVADLERFYRDDLREAGQNRVLARAWRRQFGNERSLGEMSPARFAARAEVPVLIIHGLDDTVVPSEQGEIMRDALQSAGKDVTFVPLPGEDHWLSTGEMRLMMLRHAVAFTMRHNPPG
ncbi:MAG: S9 family peptidase [Pacificimonas sp.]|jgi:pimeloyl-ACP methyl ester carboxylesterase|nr:S9 family peptidase [Pacificimonas sp.]